MGFGFRLCLTTDPANRVAAAMAVKQNIAVHHVDVSGLQKRLRAAGQILALVDARPQAAEPR